MSRDQLDAAPPVDAQPQLDRLLRHGSGRIAGYRVVRTGTADHALAAECGADDRERLLERVDRRPRTAYRAAHPANRVPERAGADAEVESAAAHDREAGG